MNHIVQEINPIFCSQSDIKRFLQIVNMKRARIVKRCKIRKRNIDISNLI